LVENKILNRLIDYFKISGRITRKTFILRMVGLFIGLPIMVFVFYLLLASIVYLLSLAFNWFGIDVSESVDLIIMILFYAALWLYIVLFIVFSLAQGIKRLHDMNSSGWWVILQFIPYVSLFYLLWLLIGDGTIGPNKYGEDPKNRIKELNENKY